jgi:plasmid stabilization system protein ParE
LPRLIVTESAVRGLERCRAFLKQRNPAAASRAAQVIAQHFASLVITPAIGRPLDSSIGLRELIIPFGDAGYVALYRHDPAEDAIYMLAFRHQREAGY